MDVGLHVASQSSAGDSGFPDLSHPMTLRDIINLGHVTNITTSTVDLGFGLGTTTSIRGILTHNYYRKEAIGNSTIYQMLPKGTEVNIGSNTGYGATVTGFYPPQK